MGLPSNHTLHVRIAKVCAVTRGHLLNIFSSSPPCFLLSCILPLYNKVCLIAATLTSDSPPRSALSFEDNCWANSNYQKLFLQLTSFLVPGGQCHLFEFDKKMNNTIDSPEEESYYQMYHPTLFPAPVSCLVLPRSALSFSDNCGAIEKSQKRVLW